MCQLLFIVDSFGVAFSRTCASAFGSLPLKHAPLRSNRSARNATHAINAFNLGRVATGLRRRCDYRMQFKEN
jgi:hypothetical protein